MDIAAERIPRIEPQRRESPGLAVSGLQTVDRQREQRQRQRQRQHMHRTSPHRECVAEPNTRRSQTYIQYRARAPASNHSENPTAPGAGYSLHVRTPQRVRFPGGLYAKEESGDLSFGVGRPGLGWAVCLFGLISWRVD